MKNKISIGILGTDQKKHVIPVLAEQYLVIDIQNDLNNCNNKINQILRYIIDVMKVDVVYNIYTTPFFWKKARLAKILKKPVITHWIGSDVLDLQNGKTKFENLKYIDFHLACFEIIQNELYEKDINSTVIPIIPFNYSFKLLKAPEKHAALIYMPNGKEEFYGYKKMRIVFENFPMIDFYIVANSNTGIFGRFQNVHCLGYLSQDQMEELYEKISFIIRMPEHDGLSMSVIEALGKGKQVIWNYKFNACIYAQDDKILVKKVRSLIQYPPVQNIAGHKYVIDNFSKDIFMNKFNKIIQEVL